MRTFYNSSRQRGAISTLLLLACCLLPIAASAQTTVPVSGHVQVLSGTGPGSSVFVRFQLVGCANGQAKIDGVTLFSDYTQDFYPSNVTGAIAGQIYPNQASPSINGIECNGVFGGTQYAVTVYKNNRPNGYTKNYVVGPGAFNLDTAVSSNSDVAISLPQVIIGNPGADQTVTQPGSTYLNVNRLNVTASLLGPFATGSVDGLLSHTDWSTFNSKQTPLGFTPENSANKDAANGYAGLDSGSKAKCSEFPALTGDVTTAAGSCATSLVNIPNLVPMAGSILATAIAAPSTPAAGKAKIYVDSTSKQLCDKDDAGVAHCAGSASVNPTSGTVPVNTSGTFADSHIVDSANFTVDSGGIVHAAQLITAGSAPDVFSPTADPGTCSDGQFWYSSTTVGRFKWCDSATIRTFVGAATTDTLTNKSIDASEINSGTLGAARMPALTGDVTSSAGAVATTLATVNSGPGSCGDATHVCQVTTNGKGLVTAQSAVAISAGGSSFGPNQLTVYEDFLNNGSNSGSIGNLGWGFFGCSGQGPLNVAGWFGAYELKTGTSSGNQCAIFLNPDGTFSTLSMTCDKDFDNYFKFALGSTSSIAMAAGFANNGIGATIQNEMAVEYDTGVPDSNFMFVTIVTGGAPTRLSSGVAADTAAHVVRIRSIDACSHVLFSLDGGSESSFTSVPTGSGALSPLISLQTHTAASKTLDMDFWQIQRSR
jgi:hypothetical protein